MRDTDKFAESLRNLSPNAAQAALSIRCLVPEFAKLRSATQDAFFAGIGAEIQQLANTYLPTVQRATTGVADAFKATMKELSNALMQPAIQTDIADIVTNITDAFRNLVPAVQGAGQPWPSTPPPRRHREQNQDARYGPNHAARTTRSESPSPPS